MTPRLKAAHTLLGRYLNTTHALPARYWAATYPNGTPLPPLCNSLFLHHQQCWISMHILPSQKRYTLLPQKIYSFATIDILFSDGRYTLFRRYIYPFHPEDTLTEICSVPMALRKYFHFLFGRYKISRIFAFRMILK